MRPSSSEPSPGMFTSTCSNIRYYNGESMAWYQPRAVSLTSSVKMTGQKLDRL